MSNTFLIDLSVGSGSLGAPGRDIGLGELGSRSPANVVHQKKVEAWCRRTKLVGPINTWNVDFCVFGPHLNIYPCWAI